MKVYYITRTRLVTERYRVTAESEEAAYDALSCESEDVEKLEESTLHSEAETERVENV
jgi:hypothetical protein